MPILGRSRTSVSFAALPTSCGSAAAKALTRPWVRFSLYLCCGLDLYHMINVFKDRCLTMAYICMTYRRKIV